MKTTSFSAIVGLLLFLVASSATAAPSVTGRVEKIRVDASGKAMVFLTSDLNDLSSAGCAPTGQWARALAFDGTTAGGKNVLSLVTSAYLAGKQLAAFGKTTCDLYSGILADLDYLYIVD